MENGARFWRLLDELSISRERLSRTIRDRDRYLVVAARTSILNEFENVLHSLGWRAGLILPRHMGEGQWLTMNGSQGDGCCSVRLKADLPRLFFVETAADHSHGFL